MAIRLCKLAAFVACFVAGQALAGITLLSPTPQRAKLGETFAPIEVRVTDAAGNPVADARVNYFVAMSGPVDTVSDADCFFELGKFCETRTDAQGIARSTALRAVQASAQPATIQFSSQGQTVAVQLFVDPIVRPMSLSVVSGANQRVEVGTGFRQPFVVQVLAPSGSPVSGVLVTFRYFNGAFLDFNGSQSVNVNTDANGLARASPRILMGIGPGLARAHMTDTTANMALTADIPYTSTTFDGRTDLDLEHMWWSGAAENGWGLSIAQRSDRLFPVLYAYDENGNPTWRVIAMGGWAYNARYERYIGVQFKTKGSPYYAYDASRFNVGDVGQSANLQFHSEVAATFEVYADNITVTQIRKAITPMDFGPDVPPRMPGVGGMWWGGQSQAGWGISVMEQPGGMFAVWFTYDANGDPTWFVMPTGIWENESTYSGTLYKTHGSPWFTGTYDRLKLTVTPVGTFRYRWTNVNNATFEWTAEGHAGSMALVRTEF